MPTQYEQGPAAAAAEKGMALDELFQRDRSANKRAMLEQAGAMARQGQQQKFTADQAGVAHARDLEKMLKGEELKEQFAQREADRSAPAIQAMISGNPDTAKSLGFGSMQGGELPVPEAGYAGTPGTFTPRQPTREEAAGMARAVPGMAQTLLQQQLKSKEALKPIVVGKDATLVSPTGVPLFSGPGSPKQSKAEADRLVAEAIAADPRKRGRIWAKQKGPDDWLVEETPSETLVENPNKWLADMMDPTKSVAERDLAASNYRKWKTDQVEIHGQKALEAARMTPMKGEALQRYEAGNMAIQAALRLQEYTQEEQTKFSGWGNLKQVGGRLLNSVGMPILTTPEESERFSNWQKDNGMVEQMKFAIGGKQLTTGEQAVVNAFIPTGREFTHYEYRAKLKSLAATMQAAQEIDFWISNNPRQDISPQETRQRYIEALRRNGVDVGKSLEENIRDQMSSGERLRYDYGRKQGGK